MSEQMTISQALRRIKKLKGEIAEHSSHATSSSSWTTETPATYNFQTEVEAMQACKCEMVGLESRVAVANANTTVAVDGQTITLSSLIRTLQEIKGEIAFYKGLNLRCGVEKKRENEWDDTSVRMVTKTHEVVHAAALTEQQRNEICKKLQDKFEDLNNKLENANHFTFI
jgi:hypothetical protein